MSVVAPEKPPVTQTSPYANVPGYNPSLPANSAQNRAALATFQARGSTPSGPPTPPPTPKPPPVTQTTPDTVQQQSKQPVISISDTQLARTNVLRQEQGLAPLESQYSLLVYSYKPDTTKSISISETQLAKTDALRSQQGDQPLEKTLPLLVYSYKQDSVQQQSKQPVISISDTQLARTNVLRQEQGLAPLESQYSLLVYSYKPDTTKPISISETQLAKTDALRSQQGDQPLEKTLPLKVVSYQKAETETTFSKTQYVQPDPIKQTIGALLAPLAYEGLGLVSLAAQATGKTILGVKPTDTEADINARIEKVFGTKAVDPGAVITSSEPIAQKAPSLIGTGLFYVLALVGGGKGKITGSPVKPSIVKNIISGVKITEEFKPISETTKTTSVVRFEQVGLPKGSEENVKPEIESSIGAKGQEIKPPTSAKVETIIGIGAKGEPIKTQTLPKATLTQKEAFGEPKIPVTLISKRETGFIAPATKTLEAQKVIAFEITPKQATELGLTQMKGLVRTYKGSLTEETISKINTMKRQGSIVESGLSLFKEPTRDVSKAPATYAHAISEPTVFGKLPELVKPEVTKLFIGGGRYKLKTSGPSLEEPAPTIKVPEGEPTPKGESINPHFTKPTQEEVESRYPLMTSHLEMNPEEIANRLTGITEEPKTTKAEPTYRPLALLSKGTLVSTEEEVLRTPPGTRLVTPTKEKTSTKQTLDVIQTISEKNISIETTRSSLISKPATDLITTPKTEKDEEWKFIPDILYKNVITTTEDTKLVPLTSYKQILNTSTKQTTKLIITTTTPEPKPTETTPPPTPPLFPKIPDKRYQFERKRKGKSKQKQGFIGNVPLENIVGVHKRTEITYGRSAENLAKREISSSERSSPKLGKSKHFELLRHSQNDFVSKKPRKLKL